MEYRRIFAGTIAALLVFAPVFSQGTESEPKDIDEDEFYSEDFNKNVDFSQFYDEEEEETGTELPEGSKDAEELIPLNDLIQGLSDGTYGRGDGSVFVDGELGVGYPGFFKSDFTITKNTGKSPFVVAFSHDSADGYGRKFAASEGYYDSSTKLDATFATSVERFDFNLAGNYAMNKMGLQNRAESFFEGTNQLFRGNGGIVINLPRGFLIAGDAFAEWYKRYLGLIKGAVDYYPYELGNSELYLSPKAYAGWHDKGFTLDLGMKYDFELLIQETGNSIINRRKFFLDFGWKNDNLDILLDSGIVLAEDITSLPVMPFGVFSLTGVFPIGSTSRPLKFDVKGGLDSYRQSYSELEMNSRFAMASGLSPEVGDFYAEASIEVPIVNMFTLSAGGLFRKTAFGMGVYEADYANLSASGSGLYPIIAFDRMLVDSQAAFKFNWNWLTITADWYAHWFHIPYADYWQTAGLSIEMVHPKKTYGGSISAREGLFRTNSDYFPVVDASFFYRIIPSLSIALELEDSIKLFMGKERTFGQSAYCTRAGSVSALLKFAF